MEKSGEDYVVTLSRGETISATLTMPAAIPEAPADVAKPFDAPSRWSIRRNDLPIRIGADSGGGSLFRGSIRRVSIFNAPVDADLIARLAAASGAIAYDQPNLVVSWQADGDGLRVTQGDERLRPKAVGEISFGSDGATLDGSSFVEIHGSAGEDFAKGLTLEAWIKPQAAQGRILDKCPAGTANGWTFDMHPAGTLRLITTDPHLTKTDAIESGKWTHVAAVADGETGRRVLYVDGKQVAVAEP